MQQREIFADRLAHGVAKGIRPDLDLSGQINHPDHDRTDHQHGRPLLRGIRECNPRHKTIGSWGGFG